MISFAEIRTRLLSDAGIAAQLGLHPASGDRAIRPDRLAQRDVLPAIEVALQSAQPQIDLGGDNSTWLCPVACVCVADTRADAQSLAEAVYDWLEAWSGATADGSVIAVEGGSTEYDADDLGDGSDRSQYTATVTVNIWYERA